MLCCAGEEQRKESARTYLVQATWKSKLKLSLSCNPARRSGTCVDVVSSGRDAVVLSTRLWTRSQCKIQVGASGFCFQTEDSVAFMREGAALA